MDDYYLQEIYSAIKQQTATIERVAARLGAPSEDLVHRAAQLLVKEALRRGNASVPGVRRVANLLIDAFAADLDYSEAAKVLAAEAGNSVTAAAAVRVARDRLADYETALLSDLVRRLEL